MRGCASVQFRRLRLPERRLVFDVNDFDETLPGPFEWDVKRLAASLAVAGRDNGFPTKARRKIVLAAAEGYRTAMRAFAKQPLLEVWYAHLDIEQAIGEWTLARAHARSGDRIALAAYLGGSAKFGQAIADFAETYADQNERDHAALQTAVKDGKAQATTEI